MDAKKYEMKYVLELLYKYEDISKITSEMT